MTAWQKPLFGTLLLLAAISCTAGEPAAKIVLLTPERAPASGEAMWLEVVVGALPKGTSLTVADAQGNLLGAVSPFGRPARQAGGGHLIPLPEALQRAGKIELRLALAENRGTRQPTADELREVKLVYLETSD
jgi:hypothetical protein